MPILPESGSMASTPEIKGKAFEQAFEKYWAQLYHHALRKLNDQEMAEDLIQECFVVLWNNAEMLDRENELQSYLYGILRHKILDVFRKDEVRLRYADGFAKKPQNYALAPDEELIAGELQKIIDDELSLMPPRMVEIYHLKRELRLSVSQIAEKLGISEQTVKNQSYRAAERLKQRIMAYDSSLLMLGISMLLRIKA
ncbi:RNA polymerase sigma-70 factor [Pedobacter miscanthi]|jgi:RNA polymerase sigma-70 factor (ECF subfamily)|uniref:RNA polymerase sigma factor n=1 Tax=Pedobacter miscanthi TaxID=2259170 RepID=UPI00292D946A|nr:RNA polymerase sigma-70 factor [Pedobacter miscanthi]